MEAKTPIKKAAVLIQVSKISIDRITKVTDLGIIRIEMVNKVVEANEIIRRQPARKQKCMGRAI